MIELAKSFVATTDEVWRLQNGTDPECKFFQTMADFGHYGGREGASRQGIYVCAANGRFLASINSNDPNRVLRMMQTGLDRWKGLTDDERRLMSDSDVLPDHRWEDSYPSDGLVLTMTTRDLPEDCLPDAECSPRWNQDQVWFSKEEARSWLPERIELDAEYELPEFIALRFAQYHLVDTVNGQTTPFGRHDIERAKLVARVIEVETPKIRIEFTGQTVCEADARRRRETQHGVATDIKGFAEFDLDESRFTSFESVAVGSRWGYTTFNGRRRQTDPSPVGFVFQLVDESQPAIAPAFIYSYNADWVKRATRN